MKYIFKKEPYVFEDTQWAGRNLRDDFSSKGTAFLLVRSVLINSRSCFYVDLVHSEAISDARGFHSFNFFRYAFETGNASFGAYTLLIYSQFCVYA